MRTRQVIESSPSPYEKLMLEVLLDIRDMVETKPIDKPIEKPVIKPIVTRKRKIKKEV